MPLLSYADLERQNNITLTDPAGRALANAIADGVLAWSARYCNRPGWAEAAYTEVFSPDDCCNLFYVRGLPLDTAETVTLTTYNDATNVYDGYTGTVRANAQGAIRTSTHLSPGYEAVKVVYTGGYTDATFPADLQQALTELLAQKWDDAQNGGKVVTEVRAIDYTEKYSLTGKDIPADIMEVLDGYRLPIVL